MAPSKYSFASVLANMDTTNTRDFVKTEWDSSPNSDSGYTTAKEERSPVVPDSFYLGPEPSKKKDDSQRYSPKRIPELNKDATPESQNPSDDTIVLPPPSPKPAQAEEDWPLPSPKFAPSKEERQVASRGTHASSQYSQDNGPAPSETNSSHKQEDNLFPEYVDDMFESSQVNDFAERPPSMLSERPPSIQLPLKSNLSFGVRKKVNLTLADFLKEIPEEKTKSPLSPLSPKSPFRPSTAKTSSSGHRSPIISVFKGFSGFGHFRNRNDSRQGSRKDSSSASSYRARTASDLESEHTSRTSWDSLPRGSNDRKAPAQTHPNQYIQEPIIFDDSLIIDPEAPSTRTIHAAVSEPVMAERYLEVEQFPGFTKEDDQHTESDVLTETDETEPAVTEPRVSSDIDSLNPQTPTDTEAPSTPAVTDIPSSYDHHTDDDASSISSMTASIITEADLSAAPPTAVYDFAPRPSADSGTSFTRHGRSDSLDSAAPPPITLLRSEQETSKPAKAIKLPKRKGLNPRINLLKRATSKPEFRSSREKVLDPEADKRERMAELELLTKSVPYEKAVRGMAPFTTKTVAETYPQRRALAMTSNSGRGIAQDRSKKRDIGHGLREERILMGAMEESHWREKERRARLAAEAEYHRIMNEPGMGFVPLSDGIRHPMGLSTIQET